MIQGFEVGKYYRWVGPKNFHANWNSDMEAWKDGASRKCIDVGFGRGRFERISGAWSYDHVYRYFVESPVMERGGQYLLDL